MAAWETWEVLHSHGDASVSREAFQPPLCTRAPTHACACLSIRKSDTPSQVQLRVAQELSALLVDDAQLLALLGLDSFDADDDAIVRQKEEIESRDPQHAEQ